MFHSNHFLGLFLRVGIILFAMAPLRAGIDARMLRYPDVSREQISFVYAGDIWVVSREGGRAHRLSSPPRGRNISALLARRFPAGL